MTARHNIEIPVPIHKEREQRSQLLKKQKKKKIPACLVGKKIPTSKQETDYFFQMAS